MPVGWSLAMAVSLGRTPESASLMATAVMSSVASPSARAETAVCASPCGAASTVDSMS